MSSCVISFSLRQELKNSHTVITYFELSILKKLWVNIQKVKFDYSPGLLCAATANAIGRVVCDNQKRNKQTSKNIIA